MRDKVGMDRLKRYMVRKALAACGVVEILEYHGGDLVVRFSQVGSEYSEIDDLVDPVVNLDVYLDRVCVGEPKPEAVGDIEVG